MNDLVSIITPSYNTAKYIGDMIRSVQAQSHTHWELIIVDDCSTDNTDAVVAEFLTDKRIRYLKNAQNSGAAISRNYALREARGKWVAFLDSDDVWLPEKLEKQLAFMKQGGYHFSYTAYMEINETSEPSGTVVIGPKKVSKCGMYCYCWPGCLTVMYDAEYVGLVQIADIRKNNDYAMWLKICKKADCYLLKEVLAQYRRGRAGSISTHTYMGLIRWHYKLFRICEQKNAVTALVLTGGNLIFGVLKKLWYVKKG